MKVFIMTLLTVLLSSSSVFSMGGDKPGPHGGHITMPGTIHVELVDKGEMIRIYLLDLSMKNPTIENSSVSLKLVGQKTLTMECKPENSYFTCLNPMGKLLDFTEIIVESVRNKVKAKEAIYKLPLKFN